MTTTAELQPIQPDQLALLERYNSGYEVLNIEGASIRAAVDALSTLSQEPGEKEMQEAVASVITSPDTPALQAVEVLPLVHSAVEPFQPKQLNANTASNLRWTMDWQAVKTAINERVKQNPEVEPALEQWFLNTGSSLVETNYAPESSKTPLYAVTGAANDQCQYRPALTLASMANPEFRLANGLVTTKDHSLNGEEVRAAGWLGDMELVSLLREHVAQRIADGEIAPRTVVFGSADTLRVLKGAELELVTTKYLSEAITPLYEDRGITEADAMLAGAIRVFAGDLRTLEITDAPQTTEDQIPAKVVTFDSAIGPITFLATTGKEANIPSQLAKAYNLRPDLFEGIDGLYGMTTAIYTWGQRASLREAASRLKLDVPVDMLGLSAHAAGIPRKLETLVGEVTNYLRAVHNVASQTLASAEKYTQGDLPLLVGATAVRSS